MIYYGTEEEKKPKAFGMSPDGSNTGIPIYTYPLQKTNHDSYFRAVLNWKPSRGAGCNWRLIVLYPNEKNKKHRMIFG